MSNLIELINQIEGKSLILKKKVDDLEIKNKELSAKIDDLQSIVQLQKIQISDLKNKNSILKVSGNITQNTKGSKKYKAKRIIESLVQEIDFCMSVLEKGKQNE